MLILARKLGERIFIGDDIVITLVSIDRGKVRLGIEAPLAVRIYREELVAKAAIPFTRDPVPAVSPEVFLSPPELKAAIQKLKAIFNSPPEAHS